MSIHCIFKLKVPFEASVVFLPLKSVYNVFWSVHLTLGKGYFIHNHVSYTQNSTMTGWTSSMETSYFKPTAIPL